LAEAAEVILSGDTAVGKALLRDYVNATLGFEGLASETGIPAKSLMRMLSPKGNPRSGALFEIIARLQKQERIRLEVQPCNLALV
jgi:DNA-binding phage protein